MTSVTSPCASATSWTASGKRSLSFSAADRSPAMALRYHALQFIDDDLFRHSPDDAFCRFPILEHQQGGDTLHAIGCSRAGVIIDIQLHHLQFTLIVAGDL